MRKSFVRIIIVVCALLALTERARAIGWDSNDFLIGGGPNFTTKIGVFDHDLTFKGFLDNNFGGVQGLDFDHDGHLVAVGALGSSHLVRVYDSTGAVVGGYSRSDDLLGNPGDIKVVPDGSYAIGTDNTAGGNGVRRFLPDGTFAQQIGSGALRAVAVVPGSRVWASGIGVGEIEIFDLGTGMQTGTVGLVGFSSVRLMAFSATTNTVLVVSQAFVREFDLQGNLLEMFASPGLDLFSAIRGANGDVFATTGSNQKVLRWHANGDFVGSFTTPVDFGVVGIVWAGNVPEPTRLIALLAMPVLLKRHQRRTG